VKKLRITALKTMPDYIFANCIAQAKLAYTRQMLNEMGNRFAMEYIAFEAGFGSKTAFTDFSGKITDFRRMNFAN
jgi:hypothetical protein